jgi:hypothetical protein
VATQQAQLAANTAVTAKLREAADLLAQANPFCIAGLLPADQERVRSAEEDGACRPPIWLLGGKGRDRERIQAPHKDANRAAVGGDRGDAVLVVARIRSDHHAHSRRLADPRRQAGRRDRELFRRFDAVLTVKGYLAMGRSSMPRSSPRRSRS